MIDPVSRFVEFTQYSTARKAAFLAAVVVPLQIPLLTVAIVAFSRNEAVDARWATVLLLAPAALFTAVGLVGRRMAGRNAEGRWLYRVVLYGWVLITSVATYLFGLADASALLTLAMPVLAMVLLYGDVRSGLAALAVLMSVLIGLGTAIVTDVLPYAPEMHERSIRALAGDQWFWVGQLAMLLLTLPLPFVLVLLLMAAFVRARGQLDDAVGLIATLSDSPDDPWAGLAAKVGGTLGAQDVQVWEVVDEGWAPVAGWPARPAASEVPADHRPLAVDGETVGALVIGRAGAGFSDFEERLVAELSAQVALLVRRRRHTAELQAAARRIVTSADAARRRIERDLHDGAQQRLVALSIELSLMAQAREAAGDAETAAQLETARSHVTEATAELRELARGLHPVVLARSGLAEALRSLVQRSTVPVDLVVECGGVIAKDVELTAYLFVSEALTNVARYSEATRADVRVVRADNQLSVAVSDDGCGGVDPSNGSGLRGMADRLAALGASLDIASPVGAGTTISTVLPCD